jgi:hypothetical protein
MKSFPLLNEIDEQINLDNIDWNKNAFQTLLVYIFIIKLKLNIKIFFVFIRHRIYRQQLYFIMLLMLAFDDWKIVYTNLIGMLQLML